MRLFRPGRTQFSNKDGCWTSVIAVGGDPLMHVVCQGGSGPATQALRDHVLSLLRAAQRTEADQ